MEQKELQELHSKEVSVFSVFSVLSAAHLNKDGNSRIRFAIINDNCDTLQFLDNGELLKNFANTEEEKKCFQFPPKGNIFEYLNTIDRGQFIFDGQYFVHRLFLETYKDDYPYVMFSLSTITGNHHARVLGLNPKFKNTKQGINFSDNFKTHYLNYGFAGSLAYSSKEYEISDRSIYKNTITVQELLDLQTKMDNEIEANKEHEWERKEIERLMKDFKEKNKDKDNENLHL